MNTKVANKIVSILDWIESKVSFLRDYLLYANIDARTLARWKRCKHLKGGRIRTSIKDYAVMTHTFPDRTTKIWCMLCGRFAWNYSHKTLWDYMVKLAEDSTNVRSSSEIQMHPNTGPIGVPSEDAKAEGWIKLGPHDSPIKGYKASKGWRDQYVKFDGQNFVFVTEEEEPR